MTGLFPPCDGADLVSQNQDVNAITNWGILLPALAQETFNTRRTIPLKLAGALAGVAVTSANTTTPPRLVGLVKAAQGLPPTALRRRARPFSAPAAASDRQLQHQGALRRHLRRADQFWDGRILETALVLK